MSDPVTSGALTAGTDGDRGTGERGSGFSNKNVIYQDARSDYMRRGLTRRQDAEISRETINPHPVIWSCTPVALLAGVLVWGPIGVTER